jgi:hypothetical protein
VPLSLARGRNTRRSDLLPVECAQFGKVGQESATDDWTDAGHAAQEVLLGTPHRALLDGLIQVGVDICQTSLQPTDVLFETFFHRRERMGETIPFGDQHLDELATARQERIERSEVLVGEPVGSVEHFSERANISVSYPTRYVLVEVLPVANKECSRRHLEKTGSVVELGKSSRQDPVQLFHNLHIDKFI